MRPTAAQPPSTVSIPGRPLTQAVAAAEPSLIPRRNGRRTSWRAEPSIDPVSRPPSGVARYGVAVACVVVAMPFTLALADTVFSRNPLALFYAAVIVAGWYGGLGPALLAAGLSAGGYAYCVMPSLLTSYHWPGLAVMAGGLAFSGILVSTLSAMRSRAIAAMRTATEAAEEARQSAETARAAAESANHAKDKFLAVLSHELRTPLTPALAATAAMAADPNLPADIRDDLAMVRRNIELEARLIDDLLDMTRVTRGKLQVAREPVDLHALIQHVMEICGDDARTKRLAFRTDLDCPRPHVSADPTRINQVLWNLVKNAVKFTPEGGRVSVRTTQGVGPGGEPTVVVEVSDSGLGIDPHVLPKIFDAFEQGDRSGSHRFGGLGLGLAISRALVKAHGGELTAASDGVGRGAKFTLRLAQLPVGAGTPTVHFRTVASDAAEAAPAGGAEGARPRVLLVEDHPDTSRVIARLLRTFGYDVRTEECVADGLAALDEATFDLILSDLGLPDGSGHDLMRAARGRLGDRTPPALALSGYGMEHDVRRSLDAGFTAHLTKPIKVDDLEAKLREIMVTSDAATERAAEASSAA